VDVSLYVYIKLEYLCTGLHGLFVLLHVIPATSIVVYSVPPSSMTHTHTHTHTRTHTHTHTHTNAHIHKALENVGMVMVFTLVSAVQEKLGELVEAVKEEMERETERREEEEKRKEEVTSP